MPLLTELVHDILREVLRAGDVAIDATAGNGHDTLFLAKRVGHAGKVLAFDVQPQALDSARAMLEYWGFSNVELICRDHARLAEGLPDESIAAITFNLGYLPSGDKSIITRPASTLTALEKGLGLLRLGGILTVLAYRGHPGGRQEAAAVETLLKRLGAGEYEFRRFGTVGNDESSPVLFVVIRRL